MTTQTITSPYDPRPFQRTLHDDAARFSVWILHRRAGKSVCALNDLIIHAMYMARFRPELPRPRLIFMAPLKSQAKRIIWDYLTDYTVIFPDRIVRQTELSVEIPSLNNARIYLLGADDPDVIRGIYADRVILDEYDQMNPRIFSEIIRPALSDRRGSCRFSGTPKGRGNLYNLYTEIAPASPDIWSRHLYTVDDTNIIDPDELIQIRRDTPEAEFEQEYRCSFEASFVGSYYADLLTTLANREASNVGFFPYDPQKPVITAWDIGLDATAVWFAQPDGAGCRLIDYYEVVDAKFTDHIKAVLEKPYNYLEHYGPHDLEQRFYDSAKTRREVAADQGLEFSVTPRLKIDEGIEAVRNFLPRCRFNEESTLVGRDALRLYSRQWDDRMQRFRDSPKHDKYSHGADAMRILALNWQDQYGSGAWYEKDLEVDLSWVV